MERQPLAVFCLGSRALLPLGGSTHPPTRARASSSLAPYLCLWPSPVPMPTLFPGESLARLSHAGAQKQPKGVLSFPKAHDVPKCKSAGVTMHSRLTEAFTCLRTMPCIPQSSSSGRRDRADPRLQPDLQLRDYGDHFQRLFRATLSQGGSPE